MRWRRLSDTESIAHMDGAVIFRYIEYYHRSHGTNYKALRCNLPIRLGMHVINETTTFQVVPGICTQDIFVDSYRHAK